MNRLEKDMVALLTDLRANYDVVGIKTEFEGEGARLDDTCRLKEITMLAGLPITLKIGGGEALTDMYMGKLIGVAHLIAPMMESAFAVTKFLEAVHKSFAPDELEDIKPEINVETVTGHRSFPEMLALPQYGRLSGVVIGRVDMARSLGLTMDDVDTDPVFSVCRDIFTASKEKYPNHACTMGGITTFDALTFLARFPKGVVDFYEQRKAIFAVRESGLEKQREGLVKGLDFEMMWYENKKNYYGKISAEDDAYVNMIRRKQADMKRQLLTR